MVSFDRFTAVLDACVLFPMIVRDVLLTLADHEFFNPRWSQTIHDEWTRNLNAYRMAADSKGAASGQIAKIRATMDAAFPDAPVVCELPELANLAPVDPKDRHVVMTALAAKADAIITFNTKDFAADHVRTHFGIDIIHPDDFALDLIDLNEKRAIAALKELRKRKCRPSWTVEDLVERLRKSRMPQMALWLEAGDVRPLL
ncbi:MAG: PIN domain-containing protein [Janthinobacterium lividum]